ncbi:MAG: lipoprotein-releasing system ATP-binding protein LolD [Desulfuromonas sp.]|nr:MAG: lipoprotein-releasing system ATP-binding protein LolD [Desulfuromonas sp.]
MISVDSLHKSYGSDPNRVEVLNDINLSVAVGEHLAVIGASGAGKTTLMHILGALDRPTSGRVEVEGQDVFSLTGAALDSFRNRTIGFVFQFNQLLPEFSALENVMMPGLIARLPDSEVIARAKSLLDDVGLSHRLSHKPGQLSGGEQQRVAIARSLVMEPKILLADEPTGNLDSHTSDEIYAVLQRLHEQRNLTMVIVTHSEQLAGRLDRIVRMQDGSLVNF